jgi:hypothetical protein
MKHIWRIVLMAILLLLTPGGSRTAGAVSPTQQAQAILESMSVAERVGQLFLVTFEGDSVTLQSDIADLILNYKVGGVALLPKTTTSPAMATRPTRRSRRRGWRTTCSAWR